MFRLQRRLEGISGDAEGSQSWPWSMRSLFICSYDATKAARAGISTHSSFSVFDRSVSRIAKVGSGYRSILLGRN